MWSFSKSLIVLDSPFFLWDDTRLHDEVKWCEWCRHCDVALGTRRVRQALRYQGSRFDN